MFILRKLFFEDKNATETNWILGDNYTITTEHNREWEVMIKQWDFAKDEIYSFITYGEGSKIIPLYKNQGNYIMTSDGKTFCNLTRHVDKQYN